VHSSSDSLALIVAGVAVCCSVLRCVRESVGDRGSLLPVARSGFSVLQYVAEFAVCCSVLQCVAACCT